MKKAANVIFIIIFSLALAGISLFTLRNGSETTSYFENRTLAKPPEWSSDAFWSGSYLNEWEGFFSDHAAWRADAIKIGTLWRLRVLRLPEVNQVVPSGGVLLHMYPYGEWDQKAPPEDCDAVADELLALKNHVEQNGGQFFYVGVPCQAAFFAELYPDYLEHGEQYLPKLHQAFAQALEQRGISYISIIDRFSQDGNPARYFTQTDHHYSLAGAFLTYQTILERINEVCGQSLPFHPRDEWEIRTLPNPFLGSRNRKLYGLYPNTDSFSYAILRQPIPFTRLDNGREVESTLVTLPEDAESTVSYTAFMGGDIGETVIRTNRPELPRVLLFGDSYTNAVETLLYASCDEFRSLDLRYYREKTLWEYIEEYRPDYVIDLRDDSMFLGESPNSTFR